MGARTLIVGDVHGCAAELQALLDQTAPDRVIFVGDLFTKGPDAPGVWQILQRTDAVAVRGNHETALIRSPRRMTAAGLSPEVREWMERLPLVHELRSPPLIVVHGGIHPVEGIAGTNRRMATTLRRWPREGDPDCAFWWQQYRGDRLVVYGHDAVRGLQDHRPRTLGLDTGCVYGGRLTGYLAEEDRIVGVPAARMYKDPRARGS